MAKEKVKKVSINALEKALKPNTVEIKMAGNDEVTIIVTPTLSLVDMLVFVNEVVESVVDSETNIYRPEMLEYMTRHCVMTMYANLTLPKDPEKAYMLMYQTDVYDQVEKEINACQFTDIKNMIFNKISHKLSVIRNAATQQAQEYLKMMKAFTESVEPLFKDVDGDDMADFLKRMSNEERLDEERIAKVIHDMNKAEDVSKKHVEAEVIEFTK